LNKMMIKRVLKFLYKSLIVVGNFISPFPSLFSIKKKLKKFPRNSIQQWN
jgi:hypothetical protein